MKILNALIALTLLTGLLHANNVTNINNNPFGELTVIREELNALRAEQQNLNSILRDINTNYAKINNLKRNEREYTIFVMFAMALTAGAIQFYVFKKMLLELDRRELLQKGNDTHSKTNRNKPPLVVVSSTLHKKKAVK